jgi:hypothetical protein
MTTRRVVIPAATLVLALLIVAFVSYEVSPANNSSTATERNSTSTGSRNTTAINATTCEEEGLVQCGQQLSNIVTKTPQFIAAENGSNYALQNNSSGIGSNGKETSFGLTYLAFSGKMVFPGCPEITGQIQVSILLTDGYYDVSNMTITHPQPFYCGNGNGPAPGAEGANAVVATVTVTQTLTMQASQATTTTAITSASCTYLNPTVTTTTTTTTTVGAQSTSTVTVTTTSTSYSETTTATVTTCTQYIMPTVTSTVTSTTTVNP